MQWIEIKITFNGSNNEKEDLIVELISDLFYSLGARGVVVDDPHLTPCEGWGSDALPLPDQPAVTGYLPADERQSERSCFLDDSLGALARANDFRYELAARTVAEEDWAESWKTFFFPVKITAKIVVKPTWRAYEAQSDEHVIEIDPGMAFGTGTHPTTALCMQLLEEHIRPGDHILDVGTGSGILLIGAAKLGADVVTGVDVDPMAVKVAEANLRLNGLKPAQLKASPPQAAGNLPGKDFGPSLIRSLTPQQAAGPFSKTEGNALAVPFNLHCGHLVDPVKGRYDIVVANILAEVVIELLDHIRRVLKPGGYVICSGIIESRRSAVEDKMIACGLTDLQSLERQEWVALAGCLASGSGGRS